MSSPEPLVPPDAPRFAGGRYVLVSRLGAGRTGAVYRGYDLATGEWRAFKILTDEAFGDMGWVVRDRFLRNGRALMRIVHPNLVRVHDVIAGRASVVVMDLVTGGTLARWIERHGPMSPGMACGAALEVARGLVALHQSGVAHGGVRESNVLVTAGGVRQLSDLEADDDSPLSDVSGLVADLADLGAMIRSLVGGASGHDALDQIAAEAGTEPLDTAEAVADALELVLVVAPPEPEGTPDLVIEEPVGEVLVHAGELPPEVERLVTPQTSPARLPYVMPPRNHEARRASLLTGQDDAPEWLDSDARSEPTLEVITITAPFPARDGDALDWEEDTERMPLIDLDLTPDPDSITARFGPGEAPGGAEPDGTDPMSGFDEVMSGLLPYGHDGFVTIPASELELFEGTGPTGSTRETSEPHGHTTETTTTTAPSPDGAGHARRSTRRDDDLATTDLRPRAPRTNRSPPATSERPSPVRGRQKRRRERQEGPRNDARRETTAALPSGRQDPPDDGWSMEEAATATFAQPFSPDATTSESIADAATLVGAQNEAWQDRELYDDDPPSYPDRTPAERSEFPRAIPQRTQSPPPPPLRQPPPIPKDLRGALHITLVTEPPPPAREVPSTPPPAVAAATVATGSALLVVPVAVSLGLSFVAIGLVALVLGSAAAEVSRAATLTETRQRALYRTLDHELPLVEQLAERSADRAQLEAAYRVYADRTLEPERSDAAFALVDAIDAAAADDAGEIGFRLRQIRSARDDLAAAQGQWDRAADGTVGRWAVALGLAHPPP